MVVQAVQEVRRLLVIPNLRELECHLVASEAHRRQRGAAFFDDGRWAAWVAGN